MKKRKLLGVWIDPLGREIELEYNCWIGHILPRHPDMAFRIPDVAITIQQPDEIRVEGIDRVYYKSIADQAKNAFVKVTMRMEATGGMGRPFVTSAYPVRIMSQKGWVEWPPTQAS